MVAKIDLGGDLIATLAHSVQVQLFQLNCKKELVGSSAHNWEEIRNWFDGGHVLT